MDVLNIVHWHLISHLLSCNDTEYSLSLLHVLTRFTGGTHAVNATNTQIDWTNIAGNFVYHLTQASTLIIQNIDGSANIYKLSEEFEYPTIFQSPFLLNIAHTLIIFVLKRHLENFVLYLCQYKPPCPCMFLFHLQIWKSRQQGLACLADNVIENLWCWAARSTASWQSCGY